MLEQIQDMRMAMQTVHLNSMYIPNTRQHLEIWAPPAYFGSIQERSISVGHNEVKRFSGETTSVPASRAQAEFRSEKESFDADKRKGDKGQPTGCPLSFVPNVDEEDVREIMGLDVENQQKLLLILGIGVFSRSSDSRYAEIMKRLAYEQRLFLIIASSDYIYGTNYQFCHGFIGKDLTNMTQQKTIQAIGRIGRNNIQQEYTVRFRDDGVLERLFKRPSTNLEAVMMNRLFCSDD